MDPNNSQPVETNPVTQPAAASMPPTEASMSAPKGKSSKLIILLVILLLLVIGIVSYFLFAKDQLNKAQKAATDNTSTVLPSPTLIPTKSPEEDLEVESPETDLMELDDDVKGL